MQQVVYYHIGTLPIPAMLRTGSPVPVQYIILRSPSYPKCMLHGLQHHTVAM